jgi:hypothetical protein
MKSRQVMCVRYISSFPCRAVPLGGKYVLELKNAVVFALNLNLNHFTLARVSHPCYIDTSVNRSLVVLLIQTDSLLPECN